MSNIVTAVQRRLINSVSHEKEMTGLAYIMIYTVKVTFFDKQHLVLKASTKLENQTACHSAIPFSD
jgi:hypothetical protein